MTKTLLKILKEAEKCLRFETKGNKSSWLFLLVKYPSAPTTTEWIEFFFQCVSFLFVFVLLCATNPSPHIDCDESAYAYILIKQFLSFYHAVFFSSILFFIFKLTVYKAFEDKKNLLNREKKRIMFNGYPFWRP